MNEKILSKKECYIVGVSGGCDSMALLSMCLDAGYQVLAAHVNYHKRASAQRDQALVEAFCFQHQIPCFCRSAEIEHLGNFQKWARDFRYAFFRELADKYRACGVLVAHHQDDLLETYLLQKQRKQIPLTWGLSAVSVVDNLSVLRPLLDFTKDDLRTYCVKHHIQFGDDESNFTDIYTRNQLRHHVIDQLSAGQRQELLVEIAAANLKRSADSGLVQEAYQACFSPFNLDIYCKTAENIRIEALRKFLIHHHFPAKSYSPAYLQELDYLILKPGNHEVMLAEDRYLAKTYNNLVVYAKKGSAYCYEISELQWLKTPYFQIQETGSQLYGVTVSPRDFPLKIRSWQKSDQIELRLGHKRINRWFIDRKIPIDQRYRWPVVENSTHEIILVPKIGCNIAHFSNNPNMFVIKL